MLFASVIRHPSPLEAQSPTLPPVVSIDWLSAELARPALVVLQLGSDLSFRATHVPAAQRLDFDAVVLAPQMEGGLRMELPAPDRLEAGLRAVGVREDSRVVIVFDTPQAFTRASRAFFTLEWAGMRGRVAVLDGGLPAWRAASKALSSGGALQVAAGDLRVRPDADRLATREAVRASADGRGRRLVDARTPEFYENRRDNGMPRGGHIASAVNLPFNTAVGSDGRLKPMAELEQMVAAAGISSDDALTTYCHIGLQASWMYLALRHLGRDVALYDGSFDEWSRDATLPVALLGSP
ncbi:MAG: sulfurtransferase [Gemmatimonadaceae bacterium]|nr:sulfurtransferase [Gemmatimonadaceae bacterium]MCW5825866.1 sulfurtransferase [Gemmatimonadaceae bacterium]